MINFSYQAIDDTGQLTSGTLTAPDYRSAARQLEERGLTLIKLDETSQKTAPHKHTSAKGVSRKELILVLYEIVTMLRAGVGLHEAIESQCKSGHSAGMLFAFESMLGQLRGGTSFTQTLKSVKLPIPEYIYYLAEAGELTGKLADALEQGVQQMEYDLQLSSDTRNALIYPAILVLSGIMAVGIMFLFVVPKFSSLLDGDSELPLLASLVLNSGTWVNDNKIFMGVLLGIAIAGSITLWKHSGFRIMTLNYASKTPVLGSWINESDIAVWAKMLGVLLSNKVPLMTALSLASRASRIPWRKLKMSQVIKKVKGGVSLSLALEQEQVITPTAINLVRVGEKAGELPATLASVSRLYDQASRNRMKSLLSLIEPLAILIIGSAIGTIILGIVLAITSANDIAV
ncbi:type II secretion system F family protein [Cellvibrio sp.]